MTPRVSVIVPTRDRRAALARALACVEAQRFRDFEVLVVDDASEDGTAAWLRAAHPAVRLTEMARPGGAAAARNHGIREARGGIVAFLDDDDRWHPAFLEAQVAQLEANPDAAISTTGHLEIDGAGRVARPDLRPLLAYDDPVVHMLAECPIHTLSVVACRRAEFTRTGLFDESLVVVHDLDWYLRAIAQGARHVHCPDVLVERAVPGGLVTRHHRWYDEERAVHRRVFASSPVAYRNRRWVAASRALLFARIGLSRGDVGFALARVAEAFVGAPIDATRIVALRLLRRLHHAPRERTAARESTAWEPQ